MKPGERLVSALTNRDDPKDLAKKVQDQWVCTEKLPIFVQLEDGRVAPCNCVEVRKGDFVDVTVGVDIVNHRNSPDVNIYFAMKRIVILKHHVLPNKVSNGALDLLRCKNSLKKL